MSLVMHEGCRVQCVAKGTVSYRRKGTVMKIEKEWMARVSFDGEPGYRLYDIKELRTIRERR